MSRVLICMSFAQVLLLSSMVAITSAAVPTDKELVQNVTLEYGCTLENVGSMKNTPYLTYVVKNGNSIPITDVELWYEVEFERNGQQGDKIRRDTYSIPVVNQRAERKDRVWLKFLSGIPIMRCDAKIRGFNIITDPKKESEIIEVGDDEFIVAPDCKDDYAKLQTMKPGMERREFSARLVRSGCVVKKPADYNRTWIPYRPIIEKGKE